MADALPPTMPIRARAWIEKIDSTCRKKVEVWLDNLIYEDSLNPENIDKVFKRWVSVAEGWEDWFRKRKMQGPRLRLTDTDIRRIRQRNQAILSDPEGFLAYLTFLASVAHLSAGERERIRKARARDAHE